MTRLGAAYVVAIFNVVWHFGPISSVVKILVQRTFREIYEVIADFLTF